MDKIEDEFKRLGPWISQFTIGNQKYGGTYSYENDPRIKQFHDCFPDVHSILELGSLEGGHTFQLAKQPGVHILGIEGRQYNIEKAKFIQRLLGLQNVTFIQANLENIELAPLGIFDAVLCSGILYHLPEPWKLVKEMSKVSKKLFIWTHYASEDKVTETINGYRGLWYHEGGVANPTIGQVVSDPLSGLSQKSFWVTINSLKDMLVQNGFININIIEVNPSHPHGPHITMAAWKG